jgi:hypothetical protein
MITYNDIYIQFMAIFNLIQQELKLPTEDMDIYFDEISPLEPTDIDGILLPVNLVKCKFQLKYFADIVNEVQDKDRANILDHLITTCEILLCAAIATLTGHDYFHETEAQSFNIKKKNEFEYLLIIN